jgi:hypothetical protein
MKQQEIDSLVTEIVNNLIEQNRIVGQYRVDINKEIENIKNHINELLKRKIPKEIIADQLHKEYDSTPTIINISTTRTVVPQVKTRVRKISITTKRGKRIRHVKIHKGPKGGKYYLDEKNKKIYLDLKK